MGEGEGEKEGMREGEREKKKERRRERKKRREGERDALERWERISGVAKTGLGLAAQGPGSAGFAGCVWANYQLVSRFALKAEG